MRFGAHLCERITNNRGEEEKRVCNLGCCANERVLRLNNSCSVSCADGLTNSVWCTLYGLACLQDTFLLESIGDRGGGWRSNSEKSIAVCRISAPSMRKMHSSSFLVHWPGPGGRTLRAWCRTFFFISIRSAPRRARLGQPRRMHRCSAQAKTRMKNNAAIHFVKKDPYCGVLVLLKPKDVRD